jgi:hypothetical protein
MKVSDFARTPIRTRALVNTSPDMLESGPRRYWVRHQAKRLNIRINYRNPGSRPAPGLALPRQAMEIRLVACKMMIN